MIPKETIDAVLKQNNIVDVIGEYLPLERKGKSIKCMCPFHNDSNPSLSIHEEKQLFKCFSCNTGGNVITFVQKYENISFTQAVKKLGDRAGMEIEVSKAPTRSLSEDAQKHIAIHKEVVNYANYQLLNDKESAAYKYITQRLSEKSIENHGIGYIENIDDFYDYMVKKGFSASDLVQAGIVSDYGSSFLSKRILFPIENQYGEVVAFSGRALNDNGPKYINSSESELFHKSKILYNLNHARDSIRQEKSLLLMEGYLDVLKAESVGINNAVATMGTALTKEHCYAIQKLKVPVNIVFDGDTPGVEAALKNYSTLQQYGIDTKLTYLPDKLDPDELITQDSEKFKELIKANGNILDFYLNLECGSSFEDIENYSLTFYKELMNHNNPLAEDFYLSKLADKTGMKLASHEDRYHAIKNVPSFDKAKKSTVENSKNQWFHKKEDSSHSKDLHRKTKSLIKFNVKEKIDGKREITQNYDRLSESKKVLAFNQDKIMNRKDLLYEYLNQKGTVLDTTITLMNCKDASAVSQGVANQAANIIAKSLGIDNSNLAYIAFLHTDTKHPHLHLQCYQKEPYLRKYELSTTLVQELTKSIDEGLNTIDSPIVEDLASPIKL